MPIILPVNLIRLLFLGFGTVAVRVFELIPERGPRRPVEHVLMLFYDDYLNGAWNSLAELVEAWGESGHPRFVNLAKWIKVTPDWENCAKRLIAKRDAAQVKSDKREKKVRVLSKYAAPIAKTVLGIIGVVGSGFFLYFLQRLIIHIQWFRVWHTFVSALPYTGWILLFAAGVFATGYLFAFILTWLVERFRRCPKCPEKVTIWMKISGGFMAGLEFIGETIGSIYTQECPLIEWGTKSEPIQKR